jgi:hypothetical protein
MKIFTKEMQGRGEFYNAMERRRPSCFARSWISIVKRAKKAGAHLCTWQGVIGSSREKSPPAHVVSHLWTRLSPHTTVLWRHFTSMRQTSSGCEITAVQPEMTFPEYPPTQPPNGIVITTSENSGIRKSTIKQCNADNTMLLHHSRRMERNMLLNWFTFQSQAESESVSRRFLIPLIITTKR